MSMRFLTLDVGGTYAVTPSHVNTPQDFTCQLVAHFNQINELSKELSRIHEFIPQVEGNLPPDYLVPGSVGCVKSKDGRWYRGVLTSPPRNDLVQVKFLDYGSIEDIHVTHLKQISKQEYVDFPIQGLEFKLWNVKPVGMSWSESENNLFRNMVIGKEFVVRVVNITPERHFEVSMLDYDRLEVNRHFRGNSSPTPTNTGISPPPGVMQRPPMTGNPQRIVRGQALVSGQTQRNQQPPSNNLSPNIPANVIILKNQFLKVGSSVVITLAAVHSFADVVCQATQNIQALSGLMRDIDQFYSALMPNDLALDGVVPGMACCARFTNDNNWFRAEIINVQGRGVEVEYIDYGNREVLPVSRLKKISTAFTSLPKQGIHCSLMEPGQSANFSPDTLQQLRKHIGENLSAQVLREVLPGKYFITLLDNIGQNILSRFMATAVAAGDAGQRHLTMPSISVGQQFSVEVTSVVSVSKFTCQLKNSSAKLDAIMDKIHNHYTVNGSTMSLSNASKGMPCCCQFTEDDGWYRAEILNVNGGEAEVKYIDYGNTEKLPVSRIKDLQPEFMTLPMQSIDCCLDTSFSDNQIEPLTPTFESLTREKTLSAILVQAEADGRFRIQLIDGSSDIGLQLSKSLRSQQQSSPRQAPSQSPQLSKSKFIFPKSTLPFGEEQNVYVSHVDNPESFYVQLSDSTGEMDTMVDAIHNHYSKLGPNDDNCCPELGMACVAKYTADNGWYRATITGMYHNGDVQVLFVDYGNVEVLKKSALKELYKDFTLLSSQGIKCALMGIQSGGQEWSTDITYGFEELVLNKELSINALQYNNESDLYQVQLFDSNRSNLSVKLLKMAGSGATGAATNPYDVLTFTKGQYENVMISHSDDPGNFWCHISEKIPEIDALMDDLFEAYDGDNMQSLGPKTKVGMSCCAKFSDGSWYRAKVLKIKGQEATIQYVDYGNTSDTEVAELKPLLPKFANLPEQAIACSLVDIAPIGASWSEESCASFNEMVIDKKLVLHVISQEESGRSLVELVNTQEDSVINESLVNKGFVKSTKSSYSSKSSRSSSKMSAKGRPVARINSQDNLSNSGSTTSLPSLTAAIGFKDASYRPGCKLAVYISHACSPAEFWCQFIETSGMLEELMNSIEEHYSRLGRTEQGLDITTVGTPCIAKYKADGGWYRGIVVNKHMGFLEINFVDYGNTERVAVTDVKQILPEFLELPIQGLKCVLKGMETNGTSPKMTKLFSDIASGIEEFNCNILTESSGVYEVDLEWNGKKMSSELVSSESKKERSSSHRSNQSDEVFGAPPTKESQRSTQPRKDNVDGGSFSRPSSKSSDFGGQDRGGFGQKADGFESKQRSEPSLSYLVDSIRIGGYEDFIVSHIENPMQFWCQSAKSCGELDKLMESINQNEHAPVDVIKSGSPCIAKFKDDDGWYRAEIKKLLPNFKAEIQFIDYGNSDTVSKTDLKMITPTFTILPAQAIECRMKGLQKEAASLTDDFEALVTEKQLVARVSGKKGKMIEIQLTDTSGDKDTVIADKLNSLAAAKPMKFTPLNIKVSGKEDIYIPSTDSGGVIYAQFGSQAALLEEIQNKLQSYYASSNTENLSNFNKNQQCCALFKEDGQWYRAIIEGPGESDSVLVRYIDFGNVEAQKKSTLKNLIQGVACVPPLAVKCVINVDNTNRWNNDTNQKFSEMVTDNLLQAEFLSDTKPYTVKLVLDGKDVGEVFRTVVVETLPDVPPKFKSNQNLLKDKVEVFVCHTVSLDQLWCQPASSADDLAVLMDSIHEVYSSLADGDRAVSETTIGTPCIAKFADDDGWYRGMITGTCDEGVNVMYVDYGNSAAVPITDIKTISSEFVSLPPQAVLCQLKGGQNWKEGAVEKFEEETTDKKLLIEKLEKRRVGAEIVSRVHLLDMGMSVLQKLLEAELGEAVSDEDDIGPPLQYESAVNLVRANESLDVYVSNVVSVDEFNIQLNKTADELAALMDTLFEIYSSDAVTNAPHSLGPCIAKYAEDGGWYRGEVTEVSKETGLVLFIDYGNAEPVPWADIKTTCIEATTLPAQAVKCQLALAGDMQSKKQELSPKFQMAVVDKPLTAEFVSLNEDVWKVKLSEDSQLLVDKLMKGPTAVGASPSLSKQQEGVYKPLCLKEGDEKRVVVTWSESPGDFWCQIESMVSDLDALSEMIQTHYSALADNAEVIADQRVGMPCVAPVEEEGVWYRSIITNCTGDQTTVRYVDYGNTGILPKLKVKIIKNAMLNQPMFAFHCSLDSVLPKGRVWSPEACTAFETDAFAGTLTATITEIVRDNYCVVALMDCNGVYINQSLLNSGVAEPDIPKCQYVHMPIPVGKIEIQISHVETPHKFFIQPTSNAEDLEAMSAKVMNLVSSASHLDHACVGNVCLAKYSLDEVWYRAVITGEEDALTFVTFIDYGNTDALQLQDLKQMPTELRSLPAQALQCKLSSVMPLGESWEDIASITFEETVLEQLYDATFYEEEDECYHCFNVVELFTKEGIPLKNILVEAGVCKISEAPQEKKKAEYTAGSQTPQYVKMPTPDGQIEIQISHVETPHKFFIQPTSNAEDLEAMSAKVMNIVSSASPLDHVDVGDVCLAKYSLDEVWYRAVITGKEDALTFVTFIDYGNTDALQLQDLKQMPTELRSLPAQALECKLSSVTPLGEVWEDTASIAFEETILEQFYDATFYGQSVELFSKEGTNLKDILVEAGICKLSEIPLKDDVAALQQSDATAADEAETLTEIASIAKLVVDDVIEGALEYLEDELKEYHVNEVLESTDEQKDDVIQTLRETAQEEVLEDDLTEIYDNEPPIINDSILSATVEQIIDDIVEASLHHAGDIVSYGGDDASSNVVITEDLAATSDAVSNGVGASNVDSIFNEDASTGDEDAAIDDESAATGEEASSTTDVVNDVTDANSNSVSTCDVTDTPASKDFKKAGSVTDEYDVIKTPTSEVVTLDGEVKTDVGANPLAEKEHQELVEELLPVDCKDNEPNAAGGTVVEDEPDAADDAVQEEDGFTESSSEKSDAKLHETDDEFLDAVEDDSELVSEGEAAESDDSTGSQQPSKPSESKDIKIPASLENSKPSESSDLENPASLEVNKPLEGDIEREVVEKVHEE